MKSADSSYRLRLIVVIALGLVMALGSFWVLELMRKISIDNAPDIVRSEPDFYVDNFKFIQLAKDGQLHYKMSGDRLTHEPLHDSYQIAQPIIISPGMARAPMTMRAESAMIEDDNSKVHLRKNVRIDRPASGQSQALHLETEYLLLLPDEDVMQSDQPVKLLLGQSTLSGNGLFANNATRELRVSGNVHGSFPPSVSH
ncbi:MAG: LPS export ABC transporter periplasmic protein LptC [Glaciimonas sp.]|nr:LPS export ABC transporter periplasmic protein LptC [Glaciimonas sp.]